MLVAHADGWERLDEEKAILNGVLFGPNWKLYGALNNCRGGAPLVPSEYCCVTLCLWLDVSR